MPLDRQAKREYQRELMRRRRKSPEMASKRPKTTRKRANTAENGDWVHVIQSLEQSTIDHLLGRMVTKGKRA